jgi:predicted flavoprotein YhiN
LQDLKDLILALEQSLRTSTNQESRGKMQPKLQRANQILAMLKVRCDAQCCPVMCCAAL